MKILDLKLLAIPPHRPRTVSSAAYGQAVAFDLEPGEAMPDLDAEGPAWLLPIAGEIEFEDDRGERTVAGPAALVALENGERPEIRARRRARLLLVAAAPEGRPAGSAGAASDAERKHEPTPTGRAGTHGSEREGAARTAP